MSRLESAIKRDRAIVLAGLAGLVVVSWLYLLSMARDMAAMEAHAALGMAMPQMQPWGAGDLGLLVVMWVVMMVAMMTPSATPMILVFAAMNRGRSPSERPAVRTGLFALGYLAMWAVYSVVAAVAQWALHGIALLSPMMVTTSPYLGGGLLMAAGVFQWTPLKRACLAQCRSPLGFIMAEWRSGARGALVMGFRHGLFCVACCWVLMALLFVAGVMNLVWVAAIAAFVLVEKAVPGAEWIARLAGVGLLLAGALVVINAGR